MELKYHMYRPKRRCFCNTSDVNSELATTPVVDTSEVNSEVLTTPVVAIPTTEEGRAAPERVRSDTDVDTATLPLCQCPRTRCPSKPGQNKKSKSQNKKSKINGIRNTAFETNGSLFPESNDDPVSQPECRYCSHYLQECDHSEEFPCGDGDWNCAYWDWDSHGAREGGPKFRRGHAEGENNLRDIFNAKVGYCPKIFENLLKHVLFIEAKNQEERASDSFYIGYFHGALKHVMTLSCKKQKKTRSGNKQKKNGSVNKRKKNGSVNKQKKTQS